MPSTRRSKNGAKLNWWKRHTQLDVFKRIDMVNGDTRECWEFRGYCPPRYESGIIRIGGIRYVVRRLVYSLYTGIPYSQVPYLTANCQNDKCSNPLHVVERKGARL